MKKLLILLFSLIISLNSYGEWIKVGTNNEGRTYYVDNDTIKEHGGHVYFWMLTDYLKPWKGYMSDQTYLQVNCKILRYKPLTATIYKGQMGKGDNKSPPPPPDEWIYAQPNTIGYSIVTEVCDKVN